MKTNKTDKHYILFTSTNFPTGGPGASYLNLFCKGVKETGGNISVYLYKGYIYKNRKVKKNRRNRTQNGVSYTHLGFSNRSHYIILKIIEDSISFFRTAGLMLVLVTQKKRITILVYSNEFLSNLPVYLISKIFGIKIVSFVPEFYDKDESKKMGIIKLIKWNFFFLNYHFLNKLSNKLIVFSSFLKNEYINRGYSEGNIIIQPNLTDINNWYIPNQSPEFTIGYAGTPSKKDGIFDLIASIKLLKERGNIINAIIMGDSIGKESYLPELQKYCEEAGISDQVTFKGLISQEDVKSYLNSCQILAITRPNSKQTKAGFPTKLGEYLGCKRIVLATKFGDIERYFKDRTDIILAEPDSPFSIVENIQWILANKEKIPDIAQQGFKKAEEILDYKKGVIHIIKGLNGLSTKI